MQGFNLDRTTPNIVPMNRMKRGQVGIIQPGSGYDDWLVICIFEAGETLGGLVSGISPWGHTDCWTGTDRNTLPVEILPEGSKVEIVA